ncbi:hypothetical protein QFC19_004742 [Naganishia cerealis]|uniref:Uncharacterized protein n=1 Tax=Naganishia cerealis TaxID=610337 RepID=A0ACC2VU25_9TREE|nr:hypothetical protein QFC19_004742 [Naganishia cerealis]
MITTEPVSTLRTSLLPALDHAPNWWNQEFSSFRRSTERRQARKAQIAAKLAEQSTTQSSPSPGTQRGSFARQQKQASHGSPLTGSPVPDPATSSRGLRARQVVQYTDSAVIKHETMDTSDDYYAQLHRKHEMGEKKQKLIESDKMSQARNKLKARTELLESTEDDTWCAHVERLLKKASRYAGDESQHEHSSGSSDNEMEDQRKLGRSKQMTEDELAEKVQRLVLLAGLELVKIKPIAQLREDLITEGRELLEKYDKTLGVYVTSPVLGGCV